MQVDLTGRRSVVTGGATGIGRAISLALARCGATVVVNYSRSADDAERTVAEIRESGGRAVMVRADVTKESEVASLMQSSVREFGGLDILISNAGWFMDVHPTTELTSDEWDAGMNLNCKALFYCVKHCVPLFPRGWGRIIVNSSMSARSGGGVGRIAYAAAKGATNNMVRGWAKEFAPRGITVNAVAPGIIRTRLHDRGTSPEEYRKLIERIPLGRDGLPEECAGAVLLLASDDGSFITGQTIEINGGMLMP